MIDTLKNKKAALVFLGKAFALSILCWLIFSACSKAIITMTLASGAYYSIEDMLLFISETHETSKIWLLSLLDLRIFSALILPFTLLPILWFFTAIILIAYKHTVKAFLLPFIHLFITAALYIHLVTFGVPKIEGNYIFYSNILKDELQESSETNNFKIKEKFPELKDYIKN